MARTIIAILAVLATILPARSTINHVEQFDRGSLSLSTDTLGNHQSTRVLMSALQAVTTPGEYAIPMKTIAFSVPFDAVEIEISVNSSSEETISLPNPVSYNLNDFDPQMAYDPKAVTIRAEIGHVGYLDGINKIVSVNLYPVNVSKNGLSIVFAQRISIDLTWQTGDVFTENSLQPIVPSHITKDVFRRTKSLVVNPGDVENNVSGLPVPLTTDQEDYDYIIITPKRFCKALERLAALRRLKGFGAKVFPLEQVLNLPASRNGDQLSGINDDAGKIRAFLQYAYSAFNTRYVLFAGKYPEMPIRQFTNLSYQNVPYNPSDLYFADLNSSWAKYINGATGQKNDADGFNELYIGRIPFETEDEINIYIDKLVIYELDPGCGDASYLGNAFLTRQLTDKRISTNYDSYWISQLRSIFGDNLIDYSAYRAGFPTGKDVVNGMNTYPCVMHTFIGHGNPGGVGVGEGYGLCALDENESFHTNEIGNGLDCLTNYNYPAWAYGTACTLMPFDIFTQSDGYVYNVTKNFGESYLLNPGGGVAMIGHTRESFGSYTRVLFKDFCFRLSRSLDYINDCESNLGTRLMYETNIFGDISTGYIYASVIRNFFGDPLINLWFKVPKNLGFTRVFDSSKNKYKYWIQGNKGEWPIAVSRAPLSDPTYSSRTELDGQIKETIEEFPNVITMAYWNDAVPVILPLYLQDYSFRDYDPRYYIVGDVYCGHNVLSNINEGDVIFAGHAETTIESMGNVTLQDGTIFEPRTKVTIKCKGEVNLSDIYVPDEVTLIINASEINVDYESVEIEEGANVILNGEKQQTYALRAKRMNQSASPVMVIPGRTWWYHAQRLFNSPLPANNFEFGIQISDETFEAYGETWHMAQITHSAIFDPDGNNPVYDDTIYPVCPIREENGRVYVWTVPRDDYSCGFEAVEEWIKYSSCWYVYFADLDQFPCEVAIYDFNTQGETTTIGTLSEPIICHLTGRRTIESHGFTYNETDEYRDQRHVRHEYTVVEGIGTYGKNDSFEFFLTPCISDLSSPGMILWPELRYVTDKDGEIIYERHGGMRLWDDMKSAVSIETPASETPVEWFNLQGLSIPRPTAPGIYIRKEGRSVSKVSIR